jgi:hypothetical protein
MCVHIHVPRVVVLMRACITHACVQEEVALSCYPLLVLHDSSGVGPTRATCLNIFICPILATEGPPRWCAQSIWAPRAW